MKTGKSYAKRCIAADKIHAKRSCNRNVAKEFMARLVAGSLDVVEKISVVLLAHLRGFNLLITLPKACIIRASFYFLAEINTIVNSCSSSPGDNVSWCELPCEWETRTKTGIEHDSWDVNFVALVSLKSCLAPSIIRYAIANRWEPWRDDMNRQKE